MLFSCFSWRVTSGLAKLGFSAAMLGGLSIAGTSIIGACEPDEHRHSPPPEGGATGACAALPGEFPPSNCEPSDNKCEPIGSCPIDAKCGAVSCLPLANNSSGVLDFRFRRLNIIAPPALTYGVNPAVQTSIINHAVDLNAKQCGETGTGAFSWLLRIDKAGGKVTTGGAPPSNDPFNAGYCFFNNLVPQGDAGPTLDVRPVTVDIDKTKSTDTSMTSMPLPKLLVPIFLDSSGSSVIILPLTKPILKDVTVTENGNCIGSFNPAALDNDCTDVFSQCSKWKTAGAVAGSISLEEADAIPIQALNGQSLCVLLTRQAPAKTCPRDGTGAITAKGDYCAKTEKPGDCQDSFWLAATFAASAIKINDGASTPKCQGGATDAGTDSGVDAGSDTGTDAPTDAADGG